MRRRQPGTEDKAEGGANETLADVLDQATYTHGCQFQIEADGNIIAAEMPLAPKIVQLLAAGGNPDAAPSVAC